MAGTISEDSFKVNLWIMKLFYLYPTEKYTSTFKIRSFLIYVLCAFPIPILSVLTFNSNFNMDYLQYNLVPAVQLLGYIVMYAPFIFNREKFIEYLNFCNLCYLNNLKNSEKTIIDKCIKSCKINTLIYLTCCIGAVTSWNARSLFWNGRQFPINIWVPLGARENLGIFYFIYLLIVAEMYYATISLAVIDSLISGLACHASAHIKILKYNLEHLYKFSIGKNRQATSTSIYRNIRQCAVYYDDVLKFAENFQSFFAPVVVSHVVSSVVVIGFFVLQLNQTDFLSFTFFQIMNALIVILGEVFFCCYYGTVLFDESNSISDAIAKSQWYKYDLKSKKALIILLERTKRPIAITCGKYIQLSLETFSTIIRRSYSLVALMQSQSYS